MRAALLSLRLVSFSDAAAQTTCPPPTFFLQPGANLDIRDEDGRTSLSHAGRNGYLEPLSILLANGAERDAGDNDGRTAVFWAAAGNKVECLRALIAAKATMDVQARTVAFRPPILRPSLLLSRERRSALATGRRSQSRPPADVRTGTGRPQQSWLRRMDSTKRSKS